MSTALVPSEGVDTSTGEVIPLPVKYDPKQYLHGLNANAAVQQQLAAAYDDACRALIGPNDVQKEGNREFKKKSAWRKLARHFGISTRVIHREREWLNDDFIASVTVRALAPWGQFAEAEGACCTDEESGRRQISVSDCIATAETRATNRAISNLIAMGEVSADELATSRPRQRAATATVTSGNQRTAADKVMPFGKQKGTRLGDMQSPDLVSARDWCMQKDAAKFKDLVDAIEEVLEARRDNEITVEAEEDDGTLPF
jgi:hypothetical protein